MASTYQIGDCIRETATFQSTASVNADPTTVTFKYLPPHPGSTAVSVVYSTSTGSITKSATGVYYADITTTGSGVYTWEWSGTGAIVSMAQGYFHVEESLVP